MTTCEPAPDGGETEPLTLFAADSLASPSLSRGRGSRRRIAGGSGQRSQASFATYDPGSSSWRTFQDCLDGEWETFSETWPASGMTRNGTAYRRPSSVPPIYATESGSWHTPQAANPEYWPTPTANPFEESPDVFLPRREREKAKGRNGNGFGLTLGMAVQLWPTPKGSAANYGRPRENDRGDLQAAVMRWPTPVASDAGTDRGSSAGWGLRNAVGGLLNPPWVEWLMGYPAGWTDCED